MRVPLSEEEQRILQEMEQKLREHDQGFVDRVSHRSHRLESSRGTKWAVSGFIFGTLLLLGTFRSSIAVGICGLLIMVVSALSFSKHFSSGATHAHRGDDGPAADNSERRSSALKGSRGNRSPGIAEEWSEMRRRMRSRFGHRD